MSNGIVGEEIIVPTWNQAEDGEPFQYTKGTVVDVYRCQSDDPAVIVVKLDQNNYLRLDFRVPSETESPSTKGGSKQTGTESVFCPQCSKRATTWESEGKYGIECPHCGYTESFSY